MARGVSEQNLLARAVLADVLRQATRPLSTVQLGEALVVAGVQRWAIDPNVYRQLRAMENLGTCTRVYRDRLDPNVYWRSTEPTVDRSAAPVALDDLPPDVGANARPEQVGAAPARPLGPQNPGATSAGAPTTME